MAVVTPLPSVGEVFFDLRGEGRSLRVSWHPEAGAVAVSFWRNDSCAASFRLAAQDLPRLLAALVQPLADQSSQPRGSETATA
jgi:hypothetical protein